MCFFVFIFIGCCFCLYSAIDLNNFMDFLYAMYDPIANSRLLVHQAALFTLRAMKELLGYTDYKAFIEHHIDCLSFQLNLMIKKVMH